MPVRDDALKGQAAVPPMAGGLPLSEAVADQAAEWLTVLQSGEASEDDRRRWRQWRAAHPDHARAWQHIEAVTRRLKMLDPRAGYQALSPRTAPKSGGRRKLAGLLLLGGAAGGAGLLTVRTQAWQRQMADFGTGIGEQRRVALEDGSVVMLDTASAFNAHIDGQRRLLRLVAGEISIVTSRAAGGLEDARPFVVETAEGRILALGTRFSVRQEEGRTRVAVQEHAVKITPADGGEPRILHAGQRTFFTRSGIDAPAAMAERDSAWTRGQIIAEDMPLEAFLAELGRYRPGLVRCTPSVAQLRLSGVFPVRDTESILAALPNVLPVQVRRRTKYWIMVEARP